MDISTLQPPGPPLPSLPRPAGASELASIERLLRELLATQRVRYVPGPGRVVTLTTGSSTEITLSGGPGLSPDALYTVAVEGGSATVWVVVMGENGEATVLTGYPLQPNSLPLWIRTGPGDKGLRVYAIKNAAGDDNADVVLTPWSAAGGR